MGRMVGFGCMNPLRLASLRVPLLLTQKGEGPRLSSVSPGIPPI